ncbi:MAG: MscL family protein [Acidimicrobiia bacterium]|nr:MscL family protein [Acidimicrobiia bacterium]MBT8247964.1 MscL family protein [Acidimicrobiia bacterium]NNJ47826.1 MscL family protein [Acidimicrobiia bacterium]NNL12499.1 MscL family protein [Acidimicrobiia bacterium]
MLKEFKEFAFGGNLVEIAVGLVMALALTALVGSLIEHVVMPIIGIIFGEPNFDSVLDPAINDSVIRFGSFLTALTTFIAIALAVFFFIVKPYKAYKARVEAGTEEPAAPPEDIVLLREIAAKVGK